MPDAVAIYTKPGCPYCAAAKEDFTRRGVSYVEHDVTIDEAAKEEALRLSGMSAVPVIVRNGEVSVGFGGS